MLEKTIHISTQFDISTQYIQGERNFRKLQLRKTDLKNSKLRQINLAGSDLSYADLRYADLSNADLSNCYFDNADLSGANLSGANLKGASLIKAYLTKANFQKAILKEAYLTDSFLTNTDFTKADLSGAFLNGTHLNGAIFQRATYDETSRFDKYFDPSSLGMMLISSFKKNAIKKISIGDVITNIENIAAITINYLGGTITAKNFEESRPDIGWLQEFSMDKKGRISFTGTITDQAKMVQLKWFEKWTNTFIKKTH